MIAAVGSVILTPWLGSYSWFIGCGLGYLFFRLVEGRTPMIGRLAEDLETVSDGSTTHE